VQDENFSTENVRRDGLFRRITNRRGGRIGRRNSPTGGKTLVVVSRVLEPNHRTLRQPLAITTDMGQKKKNQKGAGQGGYER